VRVVYLGTSAFAATVLRALARSHHEVALVVSRPDTRRGRGLRLHPPEVVTAAHELGLATSQPDDVNAKDARERIAAAAPQALVVCAFGALIREPLLSSFTILNVHPSLLPRWRGAAPIERAILAGDTHTGVSIMRLTAGLDSGPVCMQQRVAIGPQEDYGALAARLAELGGELIVRALDERPPCVSQDESLATYAPKLTAQERRLDPSEPAAAQERRVRALHPHIGAYVELEDGSRLRVLEARAQGEQLELVTVQPPGGRPMSYEAYLRGRRR